MSDLKITQGIDVNKSINAYIPTGSLICIGGSNYSSYTNIDTLGYCPCDGRAISRSTYSNLFAIIGTTYGSGDGSTTFNVPNLTDSVNGDPYFLIGSSGTISLGSKSPDAARRHTHSNPPTGNTFTSQPGSFDHNHAGSVSLNWANQGSHSHYTNGLVLGNSGGTPTGSANRNVSPPLGAASNQSHTHAYNTPGGGFTADYGPHIHNAGSTSNSSGSTSHTHTVNMTYNTSDGPSGAANLVPYVVTLYFIKL